MKKLRKIMGPPPGLKGTHLTLAEARAVLRELKRESRIPAKKAPSRQKVAAKSGSRTIGTFSSTVPLIRPTALSCARCCSLFTTADSKHAPRLKSKTLERFVFRKFFASSASHRSESMTFLE